MTDNNNNEGKTYFDKKYYKVVVGLGVEGISCYLLINKDSGVVEHEDVLLPRMLNWAGDTEDALRKQLAAEGKPVIIEPRH